MARSSWSVGGEIAWHPTKGIYCPHCRGLALLPGVGVVSASHDQTLKVWTFEGECIGELVGHTALVYCVAATEEGLIASGSEDNTLRLWRADGTCLQVGREAATLLQGWFCCLEMLGRRGGEGEINGYGKGGAGWAGCPVVK
jgi:WD40 repeat protein